MKAIEMIKIILVSSLTLTGCMKDEVLQLPYAGFTPSLLADGWEISSPEDEGFNPEALEKVYRNLNNEELYPNIRTLLVVRNHKLVGEAYFKEKEDQSRPHAVMSVTKSITSMVTGLIMDRGLIPSLEDPVYQYIPAYFDDDLQKRSITIRNLLTMEAGLDHDNDVHTGEMIYCEGSSLAYELSRPMAFAPGTDWYYGDGNPQLLSGIIRQVSGSTLEELAAEHLFKPLGIHEYYWEAHSDGLSLGGMGLWLIPRDMAKIGQLMLDGGVWEGEQLISQAWVEASTTQQTIHQHYGYYWYTQDQLVFWASGKGGQLICVYPQKDLVVVVTSDSFARGWMLTMGSYDKIFQDIYDAAL